MPTPAEPRFEDDASGEAWFQKGVTLLEGRKQEREFEEKLRRRMKHSVMCEWQFWVGMMMVLFLFFGANAAGSEVVKFAPTVLAVVMFAAAIDSAAAKRTQAVLEWIEYQKSKGGSPSMDSLPPATQASGKVRCRRGVVIEAATV